MLHGSHPRCNHISAARVVIVRPVKRRQHGILAQVSAQCYDAMMVAVVDSMVFVLVPGVSRFAHKLETKKADRVLAVLAHLFTCTWLMTVALVV